MDRQTPSMTLSRTGTYLSVVDLIRGMAAVIVALDHGLVPQTLPIPFDQELLLLVNVLFNGPAAVLVFFVVSGFCIHAPNVGRSVDVTQFAFRRAVRLGIPLIAASVVAYACDYRWFSAPFGEPAVWSLACEAIYYALYVFIQPRLQNDRQWLFALALTYVIAVIVAFEGREILQYPRRAVWAVVVMGLPIWLSGAYLAHFSRTHERVEFPGWIKLALWAIVVLGGACASVLKNKFSISYGLSLTFYGLFVAPWMYSVFTYSINNRGLKLMGASSYSLYLVHQPITEPVKRMMSALAPGAEGWIVDLATIVVVAVLALIFFFVIEKPSHKFARWWRTDGISRRSESSNTG